MKAEIPIRIVLVGPPAGVQYAVQKGKGENVSTVRSDGRDLAFDVSLTCAGQFEGGMPRFVGPFAQGPAQERFVYLTIGTAAGDLASPWTRRAKIHLSGITWATVEEVLANPGAVIEGRFVGTDKVGGPTCASQRAIGDGWRVVAG